MRTHAAQTSALAARWSEFEVTCKGVSLTGALGQDWIEGLSFGGDNEAPTVELELQIARERWENSLAPLDADSQLNKPTPLLALKAMIIVSARESPDHAMAEVFRGRIDTIDWDSNPIVVRARDLSADLKDRHIKAPRMYGLGRIPFGVRVWSAGALWRTGEYVCPVEPASGPTTVYVVNAGGTAGTAEPAWASHGSTPFSDGTATLQLLALADGAWSATTEFAFAALLLVGGAYRFINLRAGATGGTEPTWPTSPGAVVEDGSCRWALLPADSDGLMQIEAILQGIATDGMGGSVPDLYTPTAPGYWRNRYRVDEQPVLDAMIGLAQEIGWTLRLAYVDSASAHATWGKWRLRFFAPPRGKTEADATFGPDDYIKVARCAVDVAPIRNAISIVFGDVADKDPAGNPKRKTLEVSDATSIAKYQERWMGLCRGSVSGIDNITEATAVINAALLDLKEPSFEFAVELPFRWWVEVDDVFEFIANRVHFTADQTLACVAWQHRIEKPTAGGGGKRRTTIWCRGAPALAPSVWLHRETAPGVAPPGGIFGGFGALPDASSVPNGIVVDIQLPAQDSGDAGPLPSDGQWDHVEVHVSDSSGFTPSASTLVEIARTNRVEVQGLTPGTTYYVKTVVVDRLGGRSAPSAQVSAVAGYLEQESLEPGLRVGAQGELTADLAELALDSLVAFDDAKIDSGNVFDVGTGTATIPTGGAGLYRVHGELTIIGLVGGDLARVEIWDEDVPEALASGPPFPATDAGEAAATVDAILDLDEGQEIGLHLACTGSGTVDVSATGSRFYLTRVLI